MTTVVSGRNILVALLIANLIATIAAIGLVVDGRRDADARLDRTESNVRFLATQDARLRAGRRNAARRLTEIEESLQLDHLRRQAVCEISSTPSEKTQPLGGTLSNFRPGPISASTSTTLGS